MAGCASPSLSPEVCVFWSVSAFCALTLQSQPSSDTSSCTGSFLPFGAWLFGSSSGVTFLFFQYVNIIYCLFGSWQQCGFFFFLKPRVWVGVITALVGKLRLVLVCVCVFTLQRNQRVHPVLPLKRAHHPVLVQEEQGGFG